MNHRLWQTAVERAGRLAAPLALDELPDAELLGRFTAAREEPAFAAIVRRHGPLVWGVCRGLSADRGRRRGRLPGHVPRPVPVGGEGPSAERPGGLAAPGRRPGLPQRAEDADAAGQTRAGGGRRRGGVPGVRGGLGPAGTTPFTRKSTGCRMPCGCRSCCASCKGSGRGRRPGGSGGRSGPCPAGCARRSRRWRTRSPVGG